MHKWKLPSLTWQSILTMDANIYFSAHNPFFASLIYKAYTRIVFQILLPKNVSIYNKISFSIFNNLRRNFQVITFIKNHQSLQQNKENSSVLHLKKRKISDKTLSKFFYRNFEIKVLPYISFLLRFWLLQCN